jgi:hypothetical protein
MSYEAGTNSVEIEIIASDIYEFATVDGESAGREWLAEQTLATLLAAMADVEWELKGNEDDIKTAFKVALQMECCTDC